MSTPQAQRIVLVTGPFGAGRSTAINALEDIGFEAIDNMPLRLLDALLDDTPVGRPIALGFDTRTRDFSANAMIDIVDGLTNRGDVLVELLYLDCSQEVLIRRFSETRRRHPLAPAEDPSAGIERDLDLLVPIRSRAEVLIDTSDLTPHDLRGEMERWFDSSTGQSLAVSVHSFSYKRGTPRGVDMVFDVRFLRNPYWEPSLRELDGRTDTVQAYVTQDQRFVPFFKSLQEMVQLLLPAYVEEGKSHLSIGFGCTGGQHRSVALTEIFANTLAQGGWQVSKRHREIERRGDSVQKAKNGVLT
ncbi:MAG: RNase adapter RapZ [Paracoccaceae bacterium]|nr:RNase adapter RapZ [Paracoccaceae bacterium]